MSKNKDMLLLDHMNELRKVIIVAVVAVVVCGILVFTIGNQWLFEYITQPIKALNVPLITTGVTDAFIAKIKLSLIAGLFISMPLLIYLVWGFAAPALLPQEKKIVLLLAPIVLILFVGGSAFAYYLVLPLTLNFLLIMATEGLSPMITFSGYLGFIGTFVLPFGLIFEIPVIAFILSYFGILDYRLLSRKRKYALLLIIIGAAVLTPGPDVISQLIMAAPMYVLFEVSILVARITGWSRKRKLSVAQQ